ncbi:MAG TPA: hypothetical protein VFJ43_17700, partial [Bacteroidia bacterium]|nr:hypothetical protein [Bacteroidia bacterium]
MASIVIKSRKVKSESKKLTYKEALPLTLAYFEGDELAATTWLNKYAMRSPDGLFLETSPEEMHRRMAREFF